MAVGLFRGGDNRQLITRSACEKRTVTPQRRTGAASLCFQYGRGWQRACKSRRFYGQQRKIQSLRSVCADGGRANRGVNDRLVRVAVDCEGVAAGTWARRPRPRWTPENRPLMDTSKPANGAEPGQEPFLLRAASPGKSASEIFHAALNELEISRTAAREARERLKQHTC